MTDRFPGQPALATWTNSSGMTEPPPSPPMMPQRLPLEQLRSMRTGSQCRPVGVDASLLAMPWAVTESALPLTLGAVTGAGPGSGGVQTMVGDVAVLRLPGVILPRVEGWMERWVTGCEQFAARLETVAADAAAVAVLIDSPGGTVAGVQECAARIAAVAADTPVVAVADHLAASAAFWLASACTALVVSPSAMVGSVGVIMLRASISRMLDADGIDVHVLSAGDGKTDTLEAVPLTDDAEERLQATIDDFYGDFVAAVVAGRRVSRSVVTGDWGARMLTARAARAAGMADAVATAGTVIRRLGTSAGRRSFTRLAETRASVPVDELLEV